MFENVGRVFEGRIITIGLHCSSKNVFDELVDVMEEVQATRFVDRKV